jgi:hypothetical protein
MEIAVILVCFVFEGLAQIGSFCTAHMTVCEDLQTAKTTSKFCKFHIGHSNDLCHLQLSTDLRLEVASLLQTGVTITRVMDTIRDRLGSNLPRNNLLNRRRHHRRYCSWCRLLPLRRPPCCCRRHDCLKTHT